MQPAAVSRAKMKSGRNDPSEERSSSHLCSHVAGADVPSPQSSLPPPFWTLLSHPVFNRSELLVTSQTYAYTVFLGDVSFSAFPCVSPLISLGSACPKPGPLLGCHPWKQQPAATLSCQEQAAQGACVTRGFTRLPEQRFLPTSLPSHGWMLMISHAP